MPSEDAVLRELSMQARVLASIVESSNDAIVSKNLAGIITSWNKGAEHIFGFTADEAVGQPVTIIIPTDRHREEQTFSTVFGAASAPIILKQ